MVEVLLSWPVFVSSGVVHHSYATIGTVGVQIHEVGTCKHVQRSKFKLCVVVGRCDANYTRPSGTISLIDKVFLSSLQSTVGELSLETVALLTRGSASVCLVFGLLFHITVESLIVVQRNGFQRQSSLFDGIAIVILTRLTCICALNLSTSEPHSPCDQHPKHCFAFQA